MVTPAITAAASCIIAGSSVAGTTINGIVGGTDYNVVCGIQIENWTNLLLEKPCAVKNGGHIKIPPRQVLPGQKEIMLTHKVGHTACGTYGSVSWKIRDRRAVVMWSVPYDQNIHENWLAVGLTKPGQTDHDKKWFETMYYNSDVWFNRKSFSGDSIPVEFEDRDFIITGNMGSSHKTTVEVVVKPKQPKDYCDVVKRALGIKV